jgi:hypothetical protein
MTIQEYIIRFLITHPSLNLNEVKEALSKIPGAIPGKVSNAGEERIQARTGEKLGGIYFDSRWGFSLTEEWKNGEEEELHVYLEKVADTLLPFKDYLLSLKEKGCDMQFIVSVYVESNMGETLSADLLQKFAEVGVGLGFDLYPPDNKLYADRIKEGDEVPISPREAFEAMKLFAKDHLKEGLGGEDKSKEWHECIEMVIKSREDGREPWVWHFKKKNG